MYLSGQGHLDRICACRDGGRRRQLCGVGDGHRGGQQIHAHVHYITQLELQCLPEIRGIGVVILAHGAGCILTDNLLGDGCALGVIQRKDGSGEETGDVGSASPSDSVHLGGEDSVVINGCGGGYMAEQVMRIRTQRHVAEACALPVVIHRRVASIGGCARAVERAEDDGRQRSLECGLVGGERRVELSDDCVRECGRALETDQGVIHALVQSSRREGDGGHDHIGHCHGGLAEDGHIARGINSYIKIHSYGHHFDCYTLNVEYKFRNFSVFKINAGTIRDMTS